MKSRGLRIITLSFVILFVLNFSLIRSVRNFFSSMAAAVTTGIPQKLPVIEANHDGSASTSISIEVPQGTKGVIPSLALSYNSRGGNGVVGVGWDLSGIHTISRNPSFGINYNGTDSYSSSLAGELIDVSGNRSAFHSRKESWIQFVPQGSCGDGPCSWVATDKDGKKFTFGGTPDSRIGAIGRAAGSIREWALSREEDSFGNGYNVTYTPMDNTNGDYYPSTISYNNRQIQFSYENRTDKFPNYSQGSIVKMQKRLDTIEVFIAGSSFRKYDLDYTTGPVTGRSILQTLKRSGSNNFGVENYDDLTFSYSDHAGQFSIIGVGTANRSNLGTMPVFVPDFLLDIANVFFNQELPYHPSYLDSNVDLAMQFIVKMPVPDRNACNAGLASCLCAIIPMCTGGNPAFFNYVATNCAAFQGWGGVNGCLNGIDSALVAWVSMDVNGDNISDFATLNGDQNNGSIHLSGNLIQANGTSVAFADSANLPIYYNTFYQAVDLNGDGKTDFAYEYNGNLWVIYSNGNSFSSPTQFSNVNMDGAVRNMTVFSPYEYQYQYSPQNPTPVTNDRALKDYFADFNGDGLADFAHYSGGSFQIYINRKTYFDNPISVSGSSDFFINAMIDMTGDGKADHIQLVQSFDNSVLIGLSAQRDALNNQMSILQQQNQRAQDVVDLIGSGNAASINPTEFQYLIDYFNIHCGFGCVLTVAALQGSSGGTTLTPANAASLTNDLQNIVANEIGPIAQQSQTIGTQIGAILAAGTAGTATYAIQVRSFNTNNGTSQVRTYPLSGSIDPFKSTLTDANGDGNLDFVSFSGTQAVVSLFTGNGFSSPIYTSLNSGDPTKLIQFNFGEVNGDGFPDLVLMNLGNNQYETYLSKGDGSFVLNSSYSFGSFSFNEFNDPAGIKRSDSYQIWLQDMNNDGISDLSVAYISADKTVGQVSYRYNAARNSGEDMLQVVSNNSGGQRSLVQYGLANLHTGAVVSGSGNYPNLPNTSPSYLAVQTTQELSAGIVKRTNYQYSNDRVFLGVRGIGRGLGFASVKETDVDTGFYSITDYFQNDYRLAGVPQTTRSYNALNNLLSSSSNSSFSFPNPFGTEIAVAGAVTSNVYQNGSLVTTSLKSITYDSFGFATSEADSLGSHTVTNTTQYIHDTTSWRIGRVLRTRKNVDGTWVSDTQLSYSGDKILTQTQFPSSASPLTSTFGYDSFGNVTSVTDPSGGVSSIVYDSSLNLFPITKTNALGHSSTCVYDPELGLELTKTDPNGATTTMTYDAYGRILSVTYPGNSSPNETYSYLNTGLFDLNNLSNNESVTKNITDSVSGNTSTTQTFEDPMGNVIRSVSNTSLSGVNQIQDSIYDYTQGHLIQQSNSYLSIQTPQQTRYQYNDPDGNLTTILEPSANGTIQTNITRSGFTETKSILCPDGLTSTLSETKNEIGQVVSRTNQGRTTQYSYSPFGGIASITDPGGLTTTFGYDSLGRKVSTQDPNSGTITLSYDSNWRIASQTDARGKTISFTYDGLGRILTQSTNGPEAPIQYVYDDGSVPFSKGRITQVTDGTGKAEFFYSQKGEVIQQKKYIDDIIAIFKADYDSLSRPLTKTFPDGTKTHNQYTISGTIGNITMDSADGTSIGHSVVSYQGPYLDTNGNPSIKRVTGNGVTMEIAYEPIERKPIAIVTKKPDGSVIGNTEYTYDGKRNITRIDDRLNPGRTQTFTLDNLDRVISATGRYGTQNYSYSANGNLLQKGNFTLNYGDGSHANAVTTATSSSTGTMNYSYDASGNMVSRNGDVLRYDSFGKLIEITPNGGTASINYNYDYSGSRIKTVSDTALTTTYSFGDSYEIVRSSGLPEKHTIYVKGLEGEIVAQWTREDATLQLADSTLEGENHVATSIVGTLTKPFCKDVTSDCGIYWKNRIGKQIYSFLGYSSFFQEGIPTKLYNALYFLILLGVLYLAYPYFLRGNALLQELSWKGVGTPALILAMFVITSLPGCGILPGGGGQGDPPWVLAMGANVNPSVPSIQNGNSGASGGGINGGTPVNGMYFYHPDHLGSVTMITDGYGNPASGPEPGVSYVSYEPYGSINRNDSYGPDIFRYKYTGQIEDKESGLYFYKARYYEPTLGRFLQADSQVMPNAVNGLNRYMYVDGNPAKFRDPSGHVGLPGLIHMFNRIVGHAMGKDFNSKGNDKKLSANGISTGGNRFFHNATFVPKGRYHLKLGTFFDTTIGRKGIFDWIKKQTDPVIKANNNATSEAQDNYSQEPVTYEEDWVRKQVKTYWVNLICKTQNDLACALIQGWAFKDYADKARRWNSKLVNDAQVGVNFTGFGADGSVEFDGLYYHNSGNDTPSYSDNTQK
ncbi:RHS repeat-associated core domain-containing protein [Leptospira adleri]|uniref:Teneurin-like YD-shell domain-containing protein n=1 Tax=Leptospira adleri TaxID=2023186 RepID=A0A2M9YI63_9LEPT|nr:RHS repeat-associated core domain-containing protein [Leptospira adleri]PJZ51235.1 hypothetical protein CH380_21170 [Leptospira adleri]PJZ61612.1 hypothetical protein CH376_12570 [Leptospira adleri]